MKRMMNKLAALLITLSMVICSVLGCGVQNVSAKVESGYGAETTYADIGDILMKQKKIMKKKTKKMRKMRMRRRIFL